MTLKVINVYFPTFLLTYFHQYNIITMIIVGQSLRFYRVC